MLIRTRRCDVASFQDHPHIPSLLLESHSDNPIPSNSLRGNHDRVIKRQVLAARDGVGKH